AMAYWGEAMTYNHPLWSQQARETAEKVLKRLGRTPKSRAKKAGTAREKAYLNAVEILYGTARKGKRLPKDDRDDLYSDAMRRLHEAYPDDDEAACFYGLSILGAAHEGRDFATYMKAAAVFTGVWDANRDHPGAAHYLIHSYDDPVHAPLGMPMARAYSRIAPSAAHAQHMVSHIFVALGLWDDVIRANEIAIGVENASIDGEEGRPVVLGHYPHWLEYGYLQLGRFGAAREQMKAGHARMHDNPLGQERSYFGSMFARYVVDTEDWAAADWLDFEFPQTAAGAGDYYFGQAYAAVQRGDSESARGHLASMAMYRKESKRQPELVATMEQQIAGLIALKQGRNDEAIEALRESVRMELELPMAFGPPRVQKPTLELLGEALLGLGRKEEAAKAFADQLARTPLRTASLFGLARATDDAALTAECYEKIAANWHSADEDIPDFGEVVKQTRSR
ncbi:MAG: hypothetical protein IID54_03290, partial [Proteobacteria bacterium]|nr:hypothetical protein [Pseudomonadota bacterium]